MRNLRHSLAFVVLVLTAVMLTGKASHAQKADSGSIEGAVLDADGRAVSTAKVTLRGGTPPTETTISVDEEGHFTFTNITAGEYEIRTEAQGFEAVTKQVGVSARTVTHADITLAVAPINQTVVVSQTRSAEELDDLPLQVTVLKNETINQSVGLTLDDVLKQIPAFSLYRRTSTLVSQPTTDGVSLRGIGASGVSRTMVLLDGVPLNDPVGSWIYWSMVPELQIAKIEVAEGDVSSLYGSSAISGEIDITTRRPTTRTFDAEGLVGTRGTDDLDLFGGDKIGRFSYSAGASFFRTEGYTLVPAPYRGAVDINANSQHETMNGRVDEQISKDLLIFADGRFFNEDRGNGTFLQNNSTREGAANAGLRAHTADGSDWQANVFSFDQRFHSSFSSVAANRATESLSLLQTEPSYGYGANGQWSRVLPLSQLLSAGADGRWIYAREQENAFSGGANTANRNTPAEQHYFGGFFQDFWSPWRHLNVIFGARVDEWRNFDATLNQTTVSTRVITLTPYPNVSKTTVTPRAGIVFHATQNVALRAAFYQGFRAPTLDELYRSFRVGNVVTDANPSLGPERVTGYEFGANWQIAPNLFWRATAFYDRLDSPVSNVTISLTPTVITQLRENLGYVNVKGVEADLNYRFNSEWSFQGRYLFDQALVASFASNPVIVGNLLAQVPKNRASAIISYSRPSLFDADLEGRYETNRFDDVANQFPLGPLFVLNLKLSRPLGERVNAFVNIENLLNREYFVEATPVPEIGTPILVTAGVRFRLFKGQ